MDRLFDVRRRRRVRVARALAVSALVLAVILSVVVLPVLVSPHGREGDAQTADDDTAVPSLAAMGGAVLTMSLTTGWALTQMDPRKLKGPGRPPGSK